MADLIDRDAFAEKYGNYYAEEGPEYGFIGTVGDLIAKQPVVNRWIPCAEQVPKSVANRVLVAFSGETRICFGHYEKYNGEETWFNLESCMPFDCEGLKVTHWMPLPEPPEVSK